MEVANGYELRDISHGEMLCRQIIRPWMETSDLKQFEPDVPFPGAFVFKERADDSGLLRRIESLYWLSMGSTEAAHATGQAKAARDCAKQLAKDPQLPEAEQYRYGGLLTATAGEIRDTTAFDVRHLPEDDVYEHVEVELLPGYTEKMNLKAERDGGIVRAPMDAKAARRMAVKLLLQVFHERPFIPPPVISLLIA